MSSRVMSAGPTFSVAASEGEHQYSDGESEQELLLLFQKAGATEEAARLLAGNPSWPLLYHLSPERENLLSWYPFKPEGTLLEVGAGCGALTGLFCEKLSRVTAVELTETRAEIIKRRHQNRSNLEIIAGNVNSVGIERRFDYVTCIGVLEYAAQYTAGDRPYHAFLSKLGGFLAPQGCLILAIENKFGLKYWAGCNEDHTGRLFESLEGYPQNPGIRTFSRGELEKLLAECGFGDIQFYYPMPDYKLPAEMFSETYQPSAVHGLRPGILPTPELAGEREVFFDERLVMNSVVSGGMFPFFANSFLVFARSQ